MYELLINKNKIKDYYNLFNEFINNPKESELDIYKEGKLHYITYLELESDNYYLIYPNSMGIEFMSIDSLEIWKVYKLSENKFHILVYSKKNKCISNDVLKILNVSYNYITNSYYLSHYYDINNNLNEKKVFTSSCTDYIGIKIKNYTDILL